MEIEKKTDIKDVFANNLKAICIEKGIKNPHQFSSYLEEKTDLIWRYDTVRKWWRGESLPELDTFDILCNNLGVSADYLLGKISRPTYEESTLADLSGLSPKACKILADKESGFVNLLRTDNNANDLLVPLLYSESDFRKLLSILLEMPDFIEVLRKISEIRKTNVDYAERLAMRGKTSDDEISSDNFILCDIKIEHDTRLSAWKYDLQKAFISIIEKITAFKITPDEFWSKVKSK